MKTYGVRTICGRLRAGALACAAAGALILSLETTSRAQCWTTVGSAGIVDEDDLGIVTLDRTSVLIDPSVSSGTPVILNVRYNIVAVNGLLGTGQPVMRVRFSDNGTNAQVVIRLKQLNIETGADSTKLSFDSNAFLPVRGSQTQEVVAPHDAGTFFDFDHFAYCLDVEITRYGSGGMPALRAVSICQKASP